MVKKKIIITCNKEIYDKLNMLNYTNEIILKDIKLCQIQRIIDNINKNNDILNLDVLDDYLIIKKINPINFNIYYKKHESCK